MQDVIRRRTELTITMEKDIVIVKIISPEDELIPTLNAWYK